MVGVALLVLPLVWPLYTFPLVWGAFFFLLDPFCDLLGGPSLIARFAAGGTPAAPLNLLAAGLSAAFGGRPGIGSPSQVGLYPAGAQLLQGLRDAAAGLPGVSALCPGVRGHV